MTKITVSMQDFLRTGEFGPVRLEMSRGQLRGQLGEPEGWGPTPRAKHNAGIWKYGDIEFYFHHKADTLVMIFADHVGELKGGKAIDLDPWVFNGALTVKQVLRHLEEAHISCQRIDWKFDNSTERFRVGVGVELIFWDVNQYSSNEEELPSLAPMDMTFNGFSYRGRKTEAEL